MKKISLCMVLIFVLLTAFALGMDSSHNVMIEVNNGVNIAIGSDVTLTLEVAEAGEPIPIAEGTSDIAYSAIYIGPTGRAITLAVDTVAGDPVPVGVILRVTASAPVGTGAVGTAQGTLAMVDTTVNAGTLIDGIGTCWATSSLSYEAEVTDPAATFVPVTTVVLTYTMTDI